MDEQAPPEDRVLRKVLSEIIDGYTKIYLRGEDVFVKHFPTMISAYLKTTINKFLIKPRKTDYRRKKRL